jgi:hypothetical protein
MTKKSIANLMEQDSVERVPSTKELGDLMVLVNKFQSLEKEIEDISTRLDEKKANYNKLSTETIPNKLLELGLSEVKTINGDKITIQEFYSANINDENKELALHWLRENNLGDVIKHELKVQLGRGEDAKAEKLKVQLTKLKMNYIDVEGVHPQTLKAVVKEQVKAMGETKDGEKVFPMKLFNVFIGNKTKIIKAK